MRQNAMLLKVLVIKEISFNLKVIMGKAFDFKSICEELLNVIAESKTF